MNNEKSSEKFQITIVTHDGNFHSDDVFGVATLCLMLEKDHEIKIVRSRVREIIDSADYIVDTGDAYDPDTNRFDHHQKGGAGVRENGIPYASLGLVWKTYGEVVSGSKKIADTIEQKLVLPIDARDNGIDITIPARPGVTPYELRDLVSIFRTTWKEGDSGLYENFLFLVDLAKKVLLREIKRVQDNTEAIEIISKLYTESSDKKLLVLERYYPFEAALQNIPETLLVVYPDRENANWCVECVGIANDSYVSKILFPQAWAGKNNADLEDVTGVPGSIFCHNARFFAVAKTKQAAIQLAQLALKEAGK